MNLLVHILGLDNVSGRWYAFWSGIGGDLAFIAAPLVVLRRHNCHVKWCPRIGRHPVPGTTYTVCRRHHPADDPTAADIAAAAGAS